MKKILLIVFVGLISNLGFSQTAVNFNVNDCSGSNHDLFTELNAGKVVVIAFIMPCSSCIGPSLSAYTEVQNYAVSNPGRVVFYLSDDVGTTTCTTLTNWANTNGMTACDAIFSNTAVKEADYGSGGMPKIIVLAGTNHDVIYTENGGLNVTNFDNAINQGLVAGISENSKADFNLSLYPNPAANGKTTVTYTLEKSTSVIIEVYNAVGVKVKEISLENQSVGKHESILNFDILSNGVYFMKLLANDASQVLKFTIEK